MNKLYKVEGLVEKVLREYPDTRDDNFVLVFRVYKEINEEAVLRELFLQIMLYHKEYGFSSFEGIVRARRKLIKQYPELKPNRKVEKLRDKEEMNYFDYAVDGYSDSFRKFVDSQV